MLNLLPPTEKNRLHFLRTRKGVFFLSILLVVFFILFGLVLYGINYYLLSKIERQKTLVLTSQEELNQSEFQELKVRTLAINQMLSDICSFQQKEFLFSPVLSEVVALAPPGLYFKRISLRRIEPVGQDAQSSGALALSGFSSQRETVFSFKKNLEKDPVFSDIRFSPETWLKPTDIEFYVSGQFSF